MRVQILTQFYPPEIGATQTRLFTFAEGLAAAGHSVDVVCELPNHPQGTFHPGWGEDRCAAPAPWGTDQPRLGLRAT